MRSRLEKVALIVLLSVLLVSGAGFPAAAQNGAALVRVGLAQGQAELCFDFSAGGYLFDLARETPEQLALPGEQVSVAALDGMIFLNNLPVGPGPIRIIPDAGLLRWNNRSYRGEFLITAGGGRLSLINRLPVEDYLRGVVPREVYPSWPLASLKAQAVAARTYAAASLGRHGAEGFDLCATTHCQAYGGVTVEHPNTDRAVAETAGQVLTYDGKTISAFFYDSSGGLTADPAKVWTVSLPYLKEVYDWDFNSPHAQWTRSFSWPELQAMAARSYPQLGTLVQIRPLEFGKDGRVLKLALKGTLGEQTLSGEQFRAQTGIPSANIKIAVVYGPEPAIALWWVHGAVFPEAIVRSPELPGFGAEVLNPPWDLPDPWEWLRDKEPQLLVIKGSGWGHGVGLSQWGAKGMAERGYNERQILEYFYPGATITPLDQ